MNKKLMLYLCGAPIAIIAPFCSTAQNSKLLIVDDIRLYKKNAQQDKEACLVEIKQIIPSVRYHLVYATNENFMHKKRYPSGDKTYLRMPVAVALQKVAQRLAPLGYGIIVWDAYRPYRVTKKMWDMIGDERYVANPAEGSGHNRGTAIDLTLYRLNNGEQLDMGTGFDVFSDTAHHSIAGLKPQQKSNRELLKTTMEAFGFVALQTEWWHYNWAKKTFNVLDLSFRQLAKLSN